MSETWIDSVDEKRDTLETWAETELPLADDISELLERADAAGTDEMEVAAG